MIPRDFITIDPGISTGIARFENRLLVGTFLLKPDKARNKISGMVSAAQGLMRFDLKELNWDLVIVEKPRAYPGSRSKVDYNDLLSLAIMGGVVAGILATPEWRSPVPIEEIAPSDWKGQVPKKVMPKRIFEHLDDEERFTLVGSSDKDASGVDHNIMDAVGIGEWFRRKNRS